ncbi:hypothetical protein HR51_21435 [Burkholderia cepacia]|nr:hypothetical protein HR51_21435 [Burkholderia cepacia]
MSYDKPGWMERFAERVNGDREMSVIGGWFTTSISLAFGSERRCVLTLEQGKVTAINDSPRIDNRSQFGFSAPTEIWDKFLSDNPPPMYHDFFAMLMRVPQFVLVGDSLIAMQHARALHRMMNIMRTVEA